MCQTTVNPGHDFVQFDCTLRAFFSLSLKETQFYHGTPQRWAPHHRPPNDEKEFHKCELVLAHRARSRGVYQLHVSRKDRLSVEATWLVESM